MVTVNITVTDDAVQPGIYLGRQGEKQAREIVFDLSALREKYGTGTATLYHQRSKDPAPYLIGETTGTTLTWTVSETDTVYAGIGYCEFRYTFGTEGLSKSTMFATNVKASLSGDVIIPAALQAWYDALIDYIDEHGGEPGEGVPSGGAEGQVLIKKTGTDFDAEWSDDLSDLKNALQMESGGDWAGSTPAMANYSYASVGTLDGYKLTLSQGDVVSGSSARVGCAVLYNSEDFVGEKLILKPHFTISGDSSAFTLNVTKQANNDGVYTTLVSSLTDPEIELDFTNATFSGLRYNYMYFFLTGRGVTLAADTVVEYVGYELYDTSGNVRSVRLDQMENEIESLDNWITDGLTANLIQSIESNTYYRYSDGAKLAGGNYLSSAGLIPVTEGKTYTMNVLAGTQPHWTCWNAAGTFVTGSQSSGYSYTIPTGQNIKFLRASFLMANEATIMIVEGADVDYNNYYPYGHPAKYAKSEWYGKKAAMIGDSLTQMGYWEPMLSSILGLSDYSIIAQYGGNMTAIANYVSQLDSDIDILTVWAGTNDFANGITLGEFGSADTNTYAGALQHVIEYCGQHYPLMKILLITPMQRFDTTVSAWAKDSNGAYINPTNNKTLEDYANMVKTYGENYAIPVLDMYHESGFNQYNASAYSADLLHPSRPGFQRLCWRIIEKVKAI